MSPSRFATLAAVFIVSSGDAGRLAFAYVSDPDGVVRPKFIFNKFF